MAQALHAEIKEASMQVMPLIPHNASAKVQKCFSLQNITFS